MYIHIYIYINKASFWFGRKKPWLPLALVQTEGSELELLVLPGFDGLHILLSATFAGEPQRL